LTVLSVNLNKVALLRNSRGHDLPNVMHAARTVIAAGARGITMHPRPDARHATHADVRELKAEIAVELNVEGYPAPAFLDLMEEVRPAQCTLVPDEPGQLTSDHGWDLAKHGERLEPIVAELRAMGIRVSLFMDPVADAIPRARDTGADRVELYTEAYASAFAAGDYAETLADYVAAADAARKADLGINAGHDLNQANLGALLDAIPGIAEVSIGHALICEALYGGLAPTVRNYAAICARPRG
jgi:pyridoxine 5-phosphate synthase